VEESKKSEKSRRYAFEFAAEDFSMSSEIVQGATDRSSLVGTEANRPEAANPESK
jgi:hypothetical protein